MGYMVTGGTWGTWEQGEHGNSGNMGCMVTWGTYLPINTHTHTHTHTHTPITYPRPLPCVQALVPRCINTVMEWGGGEGRDND